MWFRRDLRVDDHPALAAAAERGDVVALWVADPALLGAPHHRAPMRLGFLRECLQALDAALGERGIRLVVRQGEPAAVVPAVAREAGADMVFTPFFRAWDQVPVAPRIPPPEGMSGPELASDGPGVVPGGESPITAGPAAARERLEHFIRSGAIERYAEGRDMPADDGTSHLSADLRMGVLSPAQVGRAIGADGAMPATRTTWPGTRRWPRRP